MTPDDQDRADRKHDQAVDELARRLRPWAVSEGGAMANPETFAREFINWMVEHGARWLPDTGPPPSTRPDPDPDAYRTGAARARAAIGHVTPAQPPPVPQ